MAPKRKTWLWILAAVLGVVVLCVVTVAGLGMYFASKHFKATRTTSAEAFRAFDDARLPFKDVRPLFELDRREEPKMTRRLEQMPTGATRPQMMWILAWDPEKERLVRVSMPFWMLRLGRKKLDVTSGGFDFERLQLDVEELERVGPLLLIDYRPQTGQRVLVWTQ
jgi:hypothetical protein